MAFEPRCTYYPGFTVFPYLNNLNLLSLHSSRRSTRSSCLLLISFSRTIFGQSLVGFLGQFFKSIELPPSLVYNPGHFSGMVCQVVRKKRRGLGGLEIMAAGGRYDGLVASIASKINLGSGKGGATPSQQAWLPDGYSQISRSYVFGPSGLRDYGSATLRCKI